MSYTALLATGEAYLAESFAEMFQCAPWKTTSDAGTCCYKGKEMAFYRGFQSGIALKPSTEPRGEESPNASQVVSLAGIYHQLELILERMENNSDLTAQALVCGRKWRESLAKSNLNLSVLKTPRIYGLKGLSKSCKTLTAWGMTQNGVCLDVASSAQTISEPECSLLPTPTRHNGKEGAYPAEHTRNTPSLAAQIGGKINPDWNEWRMGCPLRWSSLDAMPISDYILWREHFTGTNQKMPILWWNNDPSQVETWEVGFYMGEKKVLLSKMLRGDFGEEKPDSKFVTEKGAKIVRGKEMRSLRVHKKGSKASQRHESWKQSKIKHSYSLPIMPHNGTQQIGELGKKEDGNEIMCDLQHSVSAQEIEVCAVQIPVMPFGMGKKISRNSMGKKDDMIRLMTIGNRQIPAVVRLAWQTLTQ